MITVTCVYIHRIIFMHANAIFTFRYYLLSPCSPADRQASVDSLLVSPMASLKRTAKQQTYRPTLNRLMSHPVQIDQDKLTMIQRRETEVPTITIT